MPLLFLGAIGVGLGGLVDENRRTVDGLELPGVRRARASWPPRACRRRRASSLWPVMGGPQVDAHFHAAAATPLRPAEVYGGYVAWIGARASRSTPPCSCWSRPLLGAVPSPWGVLAVPAAALGGLAFAAPAVRLLGRPGHRPHLPHHLPAGGHAHVPVLGHVLPRRPAARTWLEPLAWLTPLWHAVELCRGATTGHAGPGRRRRPRRRASAALRRRRVPGSARAHLRRRSWRRDGMTATLALVGHPPGPAGGRAQRALVPAACGRRSSAASSSRSSTCSPSASGWASWSASCRAPSGQHGRLRAVRGAGHDGRGGHERRASSTPPSASSSSTSTPTPTTACWPRPLGVADVARGELTWALLRGRRLRGRASWSPWRRSA